MTLVTLRIIDGPQRGTIYNQVSLPITIGREEGNVVRLTDDRISRYHVKLHEQEKSVLLSDLQSTNGTRVNGEVISSWLLKPGDLIFLGKSVVLFGSADEIAGRLHQLRQERSVSFVELDAGNEVLPALAQALEQENKNHSSEHSPSQSPSVPPLDRELFRAMPPEDWALLYRLAPPTLPARLTHKQAAQLAELFQYFQLRLRYLVASAKPMRPPQLPQNVESEHIVREDFGERDGVFLDAVQWQNLLDLYGRIALYLHAIGDLRT